MRFMSGMFAIVLLSACQLDVAIESDNNSIPQGLLDNTTLYRINQSSNCLDSNQWYLETIDIEQQSAMRTDCNNQIQAVSFIADSYISDKQQLFACIFDDANTQLDKCDLFNIESMYLNLPDAIEALDQLNSQANDLSGKLPWNFNPNDRTTYNASYTNIVLDSLGETHLLTVYAIRDQNALSNNPSFERWYIFASIDRDNSGNPYPLDLDGTYIGFDDAEATQSYGGHITARIKGYPVGDGDFVGFPVVFNSGNALQSFNGYILDYYSFSLQSSEYLGYIETMPLELRGADVLSNEANQYQMIELDPKTLVERMKLPSL